VKPPSHQVDLQSTYLPFAEKWPTTPDNGSLIGALLALSRKATLRPLGWFRNRLSPCVTAYPDRTSDLGTRDSFPDEPSPDIARPKYSRPQSLPHRFAVVEEGCPKNVGYYNSSDTTTKRERIMQKRTIRVNPSEETIKIGLLGIRFLLTGDDSMVARRCSRFSSPLGRSWRRRPTSTTPTGRSLYRGNSYLDG
jgi:hypothetical protein